MKSESLVTVRYAETDQMGITHHAVYPVWYKLARNDLVKKLGMSHGEMEKMGVMTPLLELSCRYVGVTRYEDQVRVVAWMEKVTAVRVVFRYELYLEGNDEPCNTGMTAHAFVDAETFRPMNVKKKFPLLYEMMEKALEEEKGKV